MGIPSYFSHVLKQHPDILKRFISQSSSSSSSSQSVPISHLYLDSNSIIYDTYYHLQKEINDKLKSNNDTNKIQKPSVSVFEKRLVVEVGHKIKEYISFFKPSESVMIAFDGVAPCAKLNQQRQRRFKSYFQKQWMNEFYTKDNKDEPFTLFEWDTTAITPDTPFMNSLHEYIHKLTATFKEQYCLNACIVSTSKEHGEGEHKIFEYIRNHPELHEPTKNTLIYGLDADLIMLCLNHLEYAPSLYLYRETPTFIHTINSSLNPSFHYLIDIDLFSKQLSYELTSTQQTQTQTQTQTQIVRDYIFLCFLLGNDFLPHFPALNIRSKGIEYILNAYRHISKPLITSTPEKTILWSNVCELFIHLSKNEENYIQEEHKTRQKQSSHIREVSLSSPTTTKEYYEKYFNMLPMLDRQCEEYINPFQDGWNERYYQSLMHMSIIHPDTISPICQNYKEGLEWTWKYYTFGQSSIDWRWMYHYHYPPLITDFAQWLIHNKHQYSRREVSVYGNDLRKANQHIHSNTNINPVHPYVQLAYVLPKQALHYLPTHIHKRLLKQHPEWYQQTFKFSWAYCKYFWEGHADLPLVSVDEIETFIQPHL
jgi:5'-3' exonuclease